MPEDVVTEVVPTDGVETQPTETPAQETVETPDVSGETTPEATVEPTETLVDLPDGRSVTPQEAVDEYKKLQADYTRKSQSLAEYERGDINSKTTADNFKEEWIPETYEEILQRAEDKVLGTLQAKQDYENRVVQETSQEVDTQLVALKTKDPNLNEGQLFQHAMKYQFNDLSLAHSNMLDMRTAVKGAQDLATENIQKRNADPISGGPQGGSQIDTNTYDPSARNQSMQEMLRSIK